MDHMVLQLGAGRQQKAWQPSGGLAFSLKSPSSFCSALLPAHFHPSVPSLFNWHSVKVLLSASTCPCHGKQRQLGDAALSPLSPLSTLSFFPPSRTFFPFTLPSSGISPLLVITPSCFLAQVSAFVSLSFRLPFILCLRLHFLASGQT